jgi:hypothetical protein
MTLLKLRYFLTTYHLMSSNSKYSSQELAFNYPQPYNKLKANVKMHSITSHERTERDCKYKSTLSLTTALEECG